jgi:antitoxin component YwqK of YwqJK toxin-antitoxin module
MERTTGAEAEATGSLKLGCARTRIANLLVAWIVTLGAHGCCPGDAPHVPGEDVRASIPDGLHVARDDFGRKLEEVAYLDGWKEGPSITWENETQIASEGRFVHGQREGLWSWWHENGTKRPEGSFRADRMIGPVSAWNENGGIEQRVVYGEDGARLSASFWYENGQLMCAGTYVDESVSGWWIWFNEDGSLNLERSGLYATGRKIPE